MRGFPVQSAMTSSRRSLASKPNRRRLRAWVLGVGLLACCVAAASAAEPPAAPPASAPEDVLLRVKRQLKPFETLQGRFEQEKHLAKLKKPLKSRGSLALLRGRGVLWKTETPIRSLLAMTRDTVSVVRDGKVVTSLSVNEQPGLRLMGRIVFAVFAADVDEIRKTFEVVESRVAPDGSGWCLSLRPRDASFGKIIQRVELSGGAHVESLLLKEANGDSTQIRFRDLDLKAPLAADDARLLESSAAKQ